MSNIYGKKTNLDSYTKSEVDAFLLAKTDKFNGKLKQDQVPDLAITDVFTGNLTDRTNLVNNNTIESGDVFIDTSNGITYMNNGGGNNWITLSNNTGSSTFINLVDVVATSIPTNKIVYATSSGLTFTNNEIEINGGGIKCGQINPYQHETTNLGDGSNRWNNIHVKYLNAGTPLQLPNTAGSNGQVLTTDGVGVMTWTTVSSSSGSFNPSGSTGNWKFLNQGLIIHYNMLILISNPPQGAVHL